MYDLRFNVQQTGAETIDQITAKMATMKAQINTTATEMKQAADRVASAEKQMAEAVTEGHTTMANAISGLVTKEKAELDSLVVKHRELKTALAELVPVTTAAATATVELGAAHAALVPEVAAASAAIRVFEGNMPIRAVERLATNVLGLGPILQAAFPLVGAIALGEMLVSIGEKVYKAADNFFYLRDAMKAVEETGKAMAKATEGAIEREERLAVKSLRDQGRTVEAAELERRQLNSQLIHPPKLDDKAIKALPDDLTIDGRPVNVQNDIRDAYGEVTRADLAGRLKTIDEKMRALRRELVSNNKNADPTGMSTRFGSQYETALSAYANVQQFLQEEQRLSGAEGAEGDSAIGKAKTEKAKKDAAAAKQKATATTTGLRNDDEEELARLKSVHEMSLGAVIKYWEKRLAVESENVTREREITEKLGTLYQERDKAYTSLHVRAEEAQKQAEAKAKTAHDRTMRVLEETSADFDRYLDKDAEKRVRIADLKDRATESTATGASQMERLGVRRTVGTNTDKSQRVALALWEQSRLIEIDKTEAAARIASEQLISDRLKQQYGVESVEYQTQANKLLDIKLSTNDKIYAAETKLLEDVAGARERDLHKYESAAGSIFDAITNRQVGAGRALAQLLRGEAVRTGRQIFENLASPVLQSAGQAVAGIIPGMSALHGTAFDPANKKIEDHTRESAASLKSINQLLAGDPAAASSAPAGVSPGGGSGGSGVPGIINTTASGGSGSAISKIFAGLGLGASSVLSGDALSMLAGHSETQDANGNWAPASTTQRVGAGLGLAGAVAGGAFGIMSGLKQGGVSGGFTAAGSAAGAVGALVGNVAGLLKAATPLLSAIPIVGSIAALALPLIGSLFGQGTQKRDLAISQELARSQYMAPQALNATQDSGGNFADFDARGNLRSSNFSAVPTVRQAATWEQTHGLFGGPPTFYSVPGGQTSQFGAAAPPPVVIHLNAIDTRSGTEFLMNNHMAVGAAGAQALRDAHGAFSSEVQRAAAG